MCGSPASQEDAWGSIFTPHSFPSRIIRPTKCQILQIVTWWYRCLELLFGKTLFLLHQYVVDGLDTSRNSRFAAPQRSNSSRTYLGWLGRRRREFGQGSQIYQINISKTFHWGAQMECSHDGFVRALDTNGLDLLNVGDCHIALIVLPFSPSITSF